MSGHQQGGKHGQNRSDGKGGFHSSHASHSFHEAERIISPRGDYQTLLSFEKAEVIYDLTFRFAHRHLARGDRTVDQMIQAARSGKKNLLEGSKAALTSKETEIKLTNVARASLEELLDDYADYLRAPPENLGEGFQGSAICSPAWTTNAANLRIVSRVRGNPHTRSDRQHHHLPDSSGELPG